MAKEPNIEGWIGRGSAGLATVLPPVTNVDPIRIAMFDEANKLKRDAYAKQLALKKAEDDKMKAALGMYKDIDPQKYDLYAEYVTEPINYLVQGMTSGKLSPTQQNQLIKTSYDRAGQAFKAQKFFDSFDEYAKDAKHLDKELYEAERNSIFYTNDILNDPSQLDYSRTPEKVMLDAIDVRSYTQDLLKNKFGDVTKTVSTSDAENKYQTEVSYKVKGGLWNYTPPTGNELAGTYTVDVDNEGLLKEKLWEKSKENYFTKDYLHALENEAKKQSTGTKKVTPREVFTNILRGMDMSFDQEYGYESKPIPQSTDKETADDKYLRNINSYQPFVNEGITVYNDPSDIEKGVKVTTTPQTTRIITPPLTKRQQLPIISVQTYDPTEAKDGDPATINRQKTPMLVRQIAKWVDRDGVAHYYASGEIGFDKAIPTTVLEQDDLATAGKLGDKLIKWSWVELDPLLMQEVSNQYAHPDFTTIETWWKKPVAGLTD